MDTTTPENGPQEPRKEKFLALWGALVGAAGGALVFGLVFFVASRFVDATYERLMIVIGVVMGIIHGGGFGPAVALRLSQWLGRGVPSS